MPWTGFDLINAFNAWKTTEDAGRVFVVDTGGVTEINVTGLPWRAGVCQQVFEEAAVDCGRALAAWSYSGSSKRDGRRVGPPRHAGVRSHLLFRLRNKSRNGGRPTIRIDEYRAAR